MVKACNSCSKVFDKIPATAKFYDVGAGFYCDNCGDFLLVPRRKLTLDDLIAEIRNHPDVAFLEVTLAEEINQMKGVK